MTSHVALLRAVNLGSHNQVSMAALRDFITQLGFGNPRTLLQSGNVVFQGTGRGGTKLERLLEGEAEKRLGLKTEFFVRTTAEWKALVDENPFREAAERDPAHLVVMCLRAAPDPAAVKTLQQAISGPELLRTVGKQAYIVYPDGIGRSRLTTALIEKKLGSKGTGRNWNTVLKLGAALQPDATATR